MVKRKKNTEDLGDNGCWYCGGIEGDDVEFSAEFDTFVHTGCLLERLQEDPRDKEAIIMAQELGLDDFKY